MRLTMQLLATGIVLGRGRPVALRVKEIEYAEIILKGRQCTPFGVWHNVDA
jgi:hypothetical protein